MNEYFNLGVDMHYEPISSLPYSSIDLEGVPPEKQLCQRGVENVSSRSRDKSAEGTPRGFLLVPIELPAERGVPGIHVHKNADSSVERVLRELGFK